MSTQTLRALSPGDCQSLMTVRPSTTSKSSSWVATGSPCANAVAAIHESLTGIRRPLSRSCARSLAQLTDTASSTDSVFLVNARARVSSRSARSSESRALKHPGTQLTHRDGADPKTRWRSRPQRTTLLQRDEERGVGQRLSAHSHRMDRCHRFVSGIISRNSSSRPRSALGMARNSSHVNDSGRVSSGTSSATGRPLTVTVSRSPASTRLSTALTSLRRSRAGILCHGTSVAILLRNLTSRLTDRS